MPVGRFAPSPTGRLHLGNLRTALAAWLLARVDGSVFRIRFDDLDRLAVRPEHFATQLEDLAALGLDWDGPPIRQSERQDLYRPAVENLMSTDRLYPCWCSRREVREAAQAPNQPLAGHHYPGICRDLDRRGRQTRAQVGSGRAPAWRFRTEPDEQKVSFHDWVAGPTEVEVDDFVVVRGDGTPAYHLVTVIDDHELGVELVVRADDLLDSTARQHLLASSLGLTRLDHAHVPLVLNPQGQRLAKRDGAVTLPQRRALGQSPAQLVNYLAFTLGLCAEGQTVELAGLAQRWTVNDLVTSLNRQPLLLDEL